MAGEIRTTPIVDRPVIPPQPDPTPPGRHRNINGPSLIRLPDWIPGQSGRYHLYFADHKGAKIELARADELAGPWTIHGPGALHLADTPFLQEAAAVPPEVDSEAIGAARAHGVPSPLDDCTIPHIASPDAIVDDETRTIRLYYHGLDGFARQVTRVAISTDGLRFRAQEEVLAPPYLRVFRYRGWWYGIAMPGRIVRSRNGLSDFESGPLLFGPDMRHAGLWLRGDCLRVFWTRVGDAPERILLSTIDLRGDWMGWRESDAIEVRRPMRPWEGASQRLTPSLRSSVDHAVNQLRDPFVYVEGDASHLVYAVAGESGLAIARLEISE